MSEVTRQELDNKITPFQPQEATKKCIDDLISKTRHFDMIYGEYLANHSVNIFYSIYALGGTPEDCLRYYDESKTFLEPAKAPFYASYLKYFDNEVQTKGIEITFRKYIPPLINGLLGAVLHPLIHLGYAMEFKDKRVAAEGLAYASSFYAPASEIISGVEASESTKPAIDLITGFLYDQTPIPTSDMPDFILDKIDPVIQNYRGSFVQACNQWGCTTDNIEERSKDLTSAIIKIFNGSYRQKSLDFYLLHSLTGNHAIHQLLPLLEPQDQVRLLNFLFFTLSLLYIAEFRPKIQTNQSPFTSESELDSKYGWSSIVTCACRSTDSHVIKRVRYCHDLEVKFGFHNGLFRITAFRCVEDVLANGWCFKGIGLLSNK